MSCTLSVTKTTALTNALAYYENCMGFTSFLIKGGFTCLDWLGGLDKNRIVSMYSKTSFLVQIKFITEDSEQTHKRILILN